MDDTTANDIKRQLDAALQDAGANVGILFDNDVFDDFVGRKWIELKSFKILGLFGEPEKIPAYGSRAAIRAWDVPPPGFKVGKNA